MTLKCNKVELWPCPEWVAKLCVDHTTYDVKDLDMYGEESCEKYTNTFMILDRYIIWAESTIITQEDYEKFYAHKLEIYSIMSSSDIKVWMD